MLTNPVLFLLGYSTPRKNCSKKPKLTKSHLFLFTSCKSGTNGSAEMCFVCLGSRFHHLYLCVLVLFAPRKISI